MAPVVSVAPPVGELGGGVGAHPSSAARQDASADMVGPRCMLAGRRLPLAAQGATTAALRASFLVRCTSKSCPRSRTSVANVRVGLDLPQRATSGAARPRRRLAYALAALAGLVWTSPTAVIARGAEINLRPPPGMRSRSHAYVYQGALRRGMRLRASEYVRHVPDYVPGGNFFATWQTVQLLERAARRVAFRIPGARLSVGELSRAGGGPLAGHRSHQNGRDADVGFYIGVVGSRRAYDAQTFVEFDRHGRGVGGLAALTFDDARNWELVAKLVTDSDARVQYIFVADHMKARLLAYGRAVGASITVLERAATVMLQPTHGHPHGNHFHIRVYCAPEDRPACRDQAPYWSWYPGRIPGGLFASLARTRHVFD